MPNGRPRGVPYRTRYHRALPPSRDRPPPTPAGFPEFVQTREIRLPVVSRQKPLSTNRWTTSGFTRFTRSHRKCSIPSAIAHPPARSSSWVWTSRRTGPVLRVASDEEGRPSADNGGVELIVCMGQLNSELKGVKRAARFPQPAGFPKTRPPHYQCGHI